MLECRELIKDSGGPGRFRGGLGQRIVFHVRSSEPVQHSPMYDRILFPAKGFAGGLSGAKGRIYLDDGSVPHAKTKYILKAGQKVILELPGGGGFYPPIERDVQMVLEDVINGLVSPGQARETYGVVIDPVTMDLNLPETARLRVKK